MVGNVCLWRPSIHTAYQSYIVYKIFAKAGVPPGVIQFVPGSDELVTDTVLRHYEFAALHFSGLSVRFQRSWKEVGMRVGTFRNFPRLVGEMEGKNFHLVHSSAKPENVISQTVLAAFAYRGQTFSSCSRLYVPSAWWGDGKGDFAVKLVGAVDKLNQTHTTNLCSFPVM